MPPPSSRPFASDSSRPTPTIPWPGASCGPCWPRSTARTDATARPGGCTRRRARISPSGPRRPRIEPATRRDGPASRGTAVASTRRRRGRSTRPASPARRSSFLVETLADLALARRWQGRLGAAERHYEAAIELWPPAAATARVPDIERELFILHCRRGLAVVRIEAHAQGDEAVDLDDVVETLREIIERQRVLHADETAGTRPTADHYQTLVTRQHLGRALLFAGRHEEAFAEARTVADQRENLQSETLIAHLPSTLILLAELRLEAGELAEAAARLDEALALDLDEQDPRRLQATMLRDVVRLRRDAGDAAARRRFDRLFARAVARAGAGNRSLVDLREAMIRAVLAGDGDGTAAGEALDAMWADLPSVPDDPAGPRRHMLETLLALETEAGRADMIAEARSRLDRLDAEDRPSPADSDVIDLVTRVVRDQAPPAGR